MNQSVDPRIQERRRVVQATRSRGSARRLVWILALVALGATIAWIGQSPALSVAQIVVDGALYTPVESVLADGGISLGDPLLLTNTQAAEERLRMNPWVADVAVRKVFPNSIEVTVLERVAVAVVEFRTGDVVAAADGTIVSEAGDLQSLPPGRVLASTPPGLVGDVIADPLDRAAVRFLNAWTGPTAVLTQINGEIWAELDGYSVRLGGPTEMDQKARSLEAVLLEGQPMGSIINVIAPTRPTVLPPDSANVPSTPDP